MDSHHNTFILTLLLISTLQNIKLKIIPFLLMNSYFGTFDLPVINQVHTKNI